MARKYESGRKGVLSDPMRWTRNADGSYHIIATRHWLGGRTETYEYDSPTLPATGGSAWRRGMREYRDEHETARERSNRIGLSFFAFAVIVAITVYMMTR